MTIIRVTTCLGLVKHWSFIQSAIEASAKYLRYSQTMETHRRILQKIVKTPSAYCAIAFDDDLTPQGFGAAYESTPFAGTQIEYDIPYLYHQPSHMTATIRLRQDFEKFCRSRGVKRYHLTTTAFNGAAQHCIQRYGFERSHVVYKREL